MGLIGLVFTASIIAGVTLLFFKRRRFVDAVNKLPGPPGLFIFGNSFDLWKFNFNITKAVDVWAKQFNGFFRVWAGPDVYVFLTKPEDIEVLLTNSTLLDKAAIYAMLNDWIGLGLLTGPGKRWKDRRKLLAPTFHFNILEQFVDVFNRNADILLENLSKETGRKINVQPFMNLYALDVICESVMGTSLNAQSESASNYVEAVHEACSSMYYRSVKPWLTPNFVYKLTSYGKSFYKAVEVLHKYTRGVIDARRSAREARAKDDTHKSPLEEDLGIKKRSAFLDHLLDSRGNGFELSDSDVQEEVDTFMFAKRVSKHSESTSKNDHFENGRIDGLNTVEHDATFTERFKKNKPYLSTTPEKNMLPRKSRKAVNNLVTAMGHDTTSSAMSFALYNIAAHPEVQHALHDEQQDLLGDSGRHPSFRVLQQMGCLERAIKESLRLFPSVPIFGRNLTGDLHLPGGRVVPSGCNVLVSCMALHRDPEIWPDPLKYDPDRFLPDNVTGRHPFAFVPFSAGPRNCIGQKFAMLKMKAALSSVVRRFELSVSEPGCAPDPVGLVVLTAPAGIHIKLSPRAS